jgi:hypothetical protein
MAIVACISACTFDGSGLELTDPRMAPLPPDQLNWNLEADSGRARDPRPATDAGAPIPETQSAGDGSALDSGVPIPSRDLGSSKDDAAMGDAQSDSSAPDSAGVRRDAQAVGEVYFEDFSSGIEFATNKPKGWDVAGGELELGSCGRDVTYGWFNEPVWTDARVTTRLWVDDTCKEGQIGLLIRATAENPCRMYACVVDFPAGVLGVVRKGDSCGRLPANVQAPIAGLAEETWYTLQLSAVGRTITCSISGGGLQATFVTYTDPTDDPIRSGSVGLSGFGVEGRFDMLDVVALQPGAAGVD